MRSRLRQLLVEESPKSKRDAAIERLMKRFWDVSAPIHLPADTVAAS